MEHPAAAPPPRDPAASPASPASQRPRSRREARKARTRREIYRAALDLFGRRGFDGVTVEEICAAAGVARGTFFAHFPTKASLLFEFDRAMTAAFLERRERRAGAVAELRALCELLASAWLERADVMTAMLREFLRTPAAFLAAGDEPRDLSELIEDIVRRGQASGELRRGIKPRLAAAVFLSTSLAILSGGVFQPGETSPRRVREQFLEVLLHGLVDRAGEDPSQESVSTRSPS